MHRLIRSLACLAGMAIVLASAAQAQAAGTLGAVSGVVISGTTGSPVAGASLTLSGGGPSQTTTSDDHGAFAFNNLQPGDWVLRTTAPLYEVNVSGVIAVNAGQTTSLFVTLQPVTTTNITTLGRVTVVGHHGLNTTAAPIVTITSNDYINTGTTQVEQLLESTPGITIEHFDNGAPGNVATFTIRGTGGFVGGSNTGYEVLVLQDGEPIRNGQYGDADLSGLTPAIYSNVEVVKGVGGTSLFGANSIGGTVNLVTIDPKQTEGAEAIFSVGGYGSSDYNIAQTSTYGRVGYVLDYHQFATDGYVPSRLLVDNPPFTFSGSATTPPIGDIEHPTESMLLRSGLGKIKYSFSNKTNAVLTYTDEADWRDQFGLLGNPETVFLLSTFTSYSNDPLGYPYWFGFPRNYVWNTNPKYSFDVHTSLGGGSLSMRYFDDWINRWVDGNQAPPSSCCFLQKSIDHITGELATYERPFGNHNITIALGGNGDSFQYGSTFMFDQTVLASDITPTIGTQIEKTVLVRDDWDTSAKFRTTLAGYYSNYNDLNVKRFDPRLAIVNRPDENSVIRLSVGTGFAAPRLSDIVTPFDETFSSTGPNCPLTGPNAEPSCDASSGNPNLKEETATGYDLGYERTWGAFGDFSLDLYRTDLKNHIFNSVVPPPPGTPPFPNQGPPNAVLGVIEPINIAGSVYTGIEAGASIPLTDYLFVKGYYNTQAAYPTGVDLLTQQNIGNVVNNQQYQGVPLQKVGWSANFVNHQGWSATYGGDWFGPNNSYNVPAFWVFNASMTAPLSSTMSLHMALKNIYNQNAIIFSNFGGGVPYPTILGANGCTTAPCFNSTTAFSYAPHIFTVSIDERLGSLRPGSL